MQKGPPLTSKEKKTVVEKYIGIKRQIAQLSKEADDLYAGFTPSMIVYVQKVAEKDSLQKNIEQELTRLEEIDKTMGKVQAENSNFTGKLKDILSTGKESTFVPHSDVSKSKREETTPPPAQRPAPSTSKGNRM